MLQKSWRKSTPLSWSRCLRVSRLLWRLGPSRWRAPGALSPRCKNESVWRKSCAFEIKDFLRFSSYSGVQASGSRHLHAWCQDHQGNERFEIPQENVKSWILRLRNGSARRSRSLLWGLSAVTSRTCSRDSPWYALLSWVRVLGCKKCHH